MLILAWTAFISCCVVIGQLQDDDPQLVFLQMIFRHGARSPVMRYQGDPNPPETWPEGLGELTQLGRKQHYVLGKYLRSRYSHFVTSNPKEVLVNSTVYDRCLMSALANLASFYAPTPQWAFDDDINWQPIPVHYSPIEKDKYLSLESVCLRALEDQGKRFKSEEFMKLMEKHKPLLQVMKRQGLSDDWALALLFQDTIDIEKAHGLPVPSWVEPYWRELTDLSEDLFNFLFDSELQQRLRAGPILGKIIESMDDKIAGKLPDLKVQMYSSHDANLIVIMQALRVYNHKRPPFCSTLLFELYQRPSGSKEVRILYLNSSQPENITSHVPHVLQLHGCSEYCPLEYFRSFTRHLVPEDWDLECLPQDPSNRKPEDLFAVFSQKEDSLTPTPCSMSGVTPPEELSCRSPEFTPMV